MKMRTNRVTTWWENGTQFDIPAGEIVDTMAIEDVPWADRWDLKDGIKAYADQGLKFVAVKIRDWHACINSTWLEYVQVPGPTRPPGYKFGDDIRARAAAANARR